MKLLTSALALSFLVGASLDASAQYSRKDYPGAGTPSRTTTASTSGTTTSTAPSRNSPRNERETVKSTPAPAEVSSRSTTPRESTSPSRTSSRTTARTTTAPSRPRYETPPTTVYGRTTTTTTTTRPERPRVYNRVIYYGGLDRDERRDLQNRLERRAEEVGRWDYELDAWEAELYGRDYRRQDRFDPYYGYNTQRLLSERELCEWSDRLDDATRLLINREERLADVENRRYRSNDNRGDDNRSNGRGRGKGKSKSNGNGNGNRSNGSSASGMCPPGWN